MVYKWRTGAALMQCLLAAYPQNLAKFLAPEVNE